jgi:UDP-N-acetylglucosamine--N-acetylmuramyl-(pentapeptide) pyrophosphoryl-undecaprenol N-acetylglucosamine transferase
VSTAPRRRFAIACGGTGGHLFPGLAVAEVLRDRGHEVLLLVSEKEVDAVALRDHPGFASERLPGIGLPPLWSPRLLLFGAQFMRAVARCRALFSESRPDAVLGMGGFTSTAPVWAARRAGIPAFLHESNAIPGRANKINARIAGRVLLGFEECRRHFPRARCEFTGTPVRAALGVAPTRDEARAALGLPADGQVLLIMGGSQGARGINDLFAAAAPALAAAGIAVLHLSGAQDLRRVEDAYAAAGLRGRVLDFHHRMGECYAAATAAVSRSGASSLAELARFGLPSLLIPYPHATDDHQTLNAEIFARAGAAEVLRERDASARTAADRVVALLTQPARIDEMSRRSRALAPGDAAVRVADLLENSTAP